MARNSAELRLADIKTALNLMPARAEKLEALQKVVLTSRSHAELTSELMSPSLASRFLALLRVLRSGAYREAQWEHTCLALCPALYLRWKRHRLARKIS